MFKHCILAVVDSAEKIPVAASFARFLFCPIGTVIAVCFSGVLV